VPSVLVDKVHYSSALPWPVHAGGAAVSLQRISPAVYGNDPASWRAAAPTAGRANAAGSEDRDGDGMEDAWELAYFGALTRDGTGDYDRDGMPDLEEFRAGTNPVVAADLLALAFLPLTQSGPPTLQFRGVAGRTYTVQYRDALAAGTWQRLVDVLALPSSGPVTVVDPLPNVRGRFYRVVTPALAE
jgi:hypothetical protein